MLHPRLAALVFALVFAPAAAPAAAPVARPAASPTAARPLHPAPARVARPPAAPRRAPAGAALAADTLAWVGERAVTALDLVQRIEWMPFAGKSGGAPLDSVKLRGLQSLVAEALLAAESERRSPGDDPEVAASRAGLTRALARDALYRALADSARPPARADVERLARRLEPGARATELPRLRSLAADSLRVLAGRARAAQFMVSHLAGRSAQVDSAVFTLLADSLRAYVLVAEPDHAQGGGIIVPTEAPDVLRGRLAGSLGRTLVRLPDGPLTLGDALVDLRFYLVVVRSLAPRPFAYDLNVGLHLLVEGELMAREALRRRLDRRPEVQHDVARWMDAQRAHQMLASLGRGVAGPAGDDAAFRELALLEPERAKASCEVDVQEVLCASAAEGEEARSAIAAGSSFDSVAARRTRRTEWAAGGGRSGYFRVSTRPELGFAALLTPLDSLTGPLILPEGMSVFRVRGKRLAGDAGGGAHELLERARSAATSRARSERVARAVAELANGTSVRFAPGRLGAIEILDANMVVRRTLGFGGGMLASPALPPDWEWTRYWRGPRTALP